MTLTFGALSLLFLGFFWLTLGGWVGVASQRR
ncbi:hypothetical protein MCBRY_003619 [Methylocystis bryophila]